MTLVGQYYGLSIGANDPGRNIPAVSQLIAVGGTNGTPFWLHVVGTAVGFEWVPPFTVGFMYPFPNPVTSVLLRTDQLPPWQSGVANLTSKLTASVSGVAYVPGEPPPTYQSGIQIASINILDRATLAATSLNTGYNQTAPGPYFDTYIISWLWSITAGASTSAGPAIKGIQTQTVVVIDQFNVAANGFGVGSQSPAVPWRVSSLLPNDTSFEVGINSDTTVVSVTRGSLLLGS